MHDTAAAALSPFDIAALLVVAAAVFGYINHHYIRLPHVIGLTIMGALAAIVLTVLNALVPSITLDDSVSRLLEQLNFTDTLLQGMLSFLLFAGALHVDLKRLSADWLPVLLLSTVGVVTSTVLVGGATWGLGLLLGVEIAPIWYFVFGALISPTDPVSVLGVLKTEDVPLSLQSAVAGESLFNDGVGIVVFTILLGAAVTGAGVARRIAPARRVPVDVTISHPELRRSRARTEHPVVISSWRASAKASMIRTDPPRIP